MLKMAFNGFAMSIGLLGICLLSFSVCDPPEPWGERKCKTQPKPLTLEQFYQEYRASGLPLPPQGSQLIRLDRKHLYVKQSGEKSLSSQVWLFILLRPKSNGIPARVLNGIEERDEYSDSNLRVVPPTVEAFKDSQWSNARANQEAAFAAQAYHLGWLGLAKVAYAQAIEFGDPMSLQLHRLIWFYNYNQLQKPESNRRKAFVRLKELSELPDIITDQFITDQGLMEWLLVPLEATLKTPPLRTDPAESRIDELVDYTDGSFPFPITKLGFDAVPALIRHCNDIRFTRSATFAGFNNSSYFRLRTVGEVCRQILIAYSDDELDRDDEDISPDEWEKAARNWFERARKIEEEPWVLLHVVTTNGKVNSALLDIVQAKYPKFLPVIYRRILRSGDGDDSEAYLTKSVSTSSLSRTEKLSLFHDACNAWPVGHRVHALYELHALDEQEFFAGWAKTLSALEGGLSTEGTIPEGDGLNALIPVLLLARTDVDWESVTRVLLRRPFTERMEVLRSLANVILDDKKKPYNAGIFKLICNLLSDQTVWEANNKGKWDDEISANSYQKLAVRDYASLILSEYFDLGFNMCSQSTPSEWAVLRTKVRAAVEKELALMKK
ncbi:MAG TPA: hypothetical protein VGJ05_22100 [Fimbriiglobus sp.]|jgi:hypothetical protein